MSACVHYLGSHWWGLCLPQCRYSSSWLLLKSLLWFTPHKLLLRSPALQRGTHLFTQVQLLCAISTDPWNHISLLPKWHVFLLPFLLALLMANSCQSPPFRILKARVCKSLHQEEERGKATHRLACTHIRMYSWCMSKKTPRSLYSFLTVGNGHHWTLWMQGRVYHPLFSAEILWKQGKLHSYFVFQVWMLS